MTFESLQETLERTDRVYEGIKRLQAENRELRAALQALLDQVRTPDIASCSCAECEADRAAVARARQLLEKGRS